MDMINNFLSNKPSKHMLNRIAMFNLRLKGLTLLIAIFSFTYPDSTYGQKSPETSWEELIVSFPYLGQIQLRTTHEIEASNWSVGGETMDRDYTIYDNWKAHVEALGIKKVRLQSGWAKTEKEKGTYDFQWLDDIVYDLKEKGVDPWISLSYGNPLYKDGGGTRLGAKLPTSGEAYTGWKNYVSTIVERYKDIVTEWEVWNEPNLKSAGNPNESYGKLLLETAKLIKEIQPEATVIGIAMAGVNAKLAGEVLDYLADRDGLIYLDAITYHPYARNPDNSYASVEALRETVQRYDKRIYIYQGENGAPSEWRKTKALSQYDWTELSQAKWALRRLLGDLGRDIPSSYFSMVDMKYPDEINRKGLLLIDDDKKVVRPKHAYFAVQHLASVFDDAVKRVSNFPFQTNTYHSLSLFAYEHSESEQQLLTVWFDGNTPSDFNTTTEVDFVFEQGEFLDPVYVDLRTGKVYDIPSMNWQARDGTHYFYQIPIYDSPILIADSTTLKFN